MKRGILLFTHTPTDSYFDVTIPSITSYNKIRLALVAGSSEWTLEADKTINRLCFYPLGSTNLSYTSDLPLEVVIGFICGSLIQIDWSNGHIYIDNYARTNVNFMTGLMQVWAIQ